jgi:hypothetical protein
MSDSLSFKKALSFRIKPGTRRKTIKKIGKPITEFVTNVRNSIKLPNFRKSFNKSFGRIPYIQGKQVYNVSPIKEKMNPIFGRGLKKNKTRKHR